MISSQSAAFSEASPIWRPSCPGGLKEPAGHRFDSTSAGSLVDQRQLFVTPRFPLMRATSGGGGGGGGGRSGSTMMRVVGNSSESRLGAQRRTVAQPDEGSGNGEEDSEEGPTCAHPVLVVVDANKEVSTHALDWALSYVVQNGDRVKLLGVLHHILNPMGYKSRADEKSWNGANRKILDAEIAAHMVMFNNIPNVYERVEKLGAKLEIEVRAHVQSKTVVVEEAKRLNARYVVIDRHIKKDKKFYIENLSCFVTRVKSVTKFEHLRPGVPESHKEEMQATPAVPSPAPATQTPALPPESVAQPQFFSHHHHLGMPSPGYIPCDDSLTSGSTLPSGYFYGMAYAHEMGHIAYDQAQAGSTMESAMRETALRRWLVDAGSQLGEGPTLHHSRVSELGRTTIGYSGDSSMRHTPPAPTPVTEEVLAGYMSSLRIYQGMSGSLPPMAARKPNADHRPAYGPASYKTADHHQRRQQVSSKSMQHACQYPAARSEYAAESAVRSIASDVTPKSSNLGTVPAPISVQPRRAADASWALDLLGLGNPEVQALAMPRERMDEVEESHSGPPRTRYSSIRRVVSSKKQSAGAPPLCSVCKQQSPDFGKVKRFTFQELQDATDNFSGEQYMAEGGYGSVYKGLLKEGQPVAVKQHKLASSQTDEKFAAEVEALACAQHRNLVTLIGYCVHNKRRLLVYEYICNGSLDRHLSAKSKSDLQWKVRLKIAVGAARALRYLHEECRVGCIIHRDMRPNNILLTHDFTPMVGDFGLARRQPSGDEEEETRVLGTIGYVAPEYAETGKITDKADVYAFGVVLLELITGRKAIDYSQPRDEILLTEWARPLLHSYDMQLVDPRLKSDFDEYEMHCMMHAANQCIKRDPSIRPRMVQVLRILNPPESGDWAYARGRHAGPVMVASDGYLSQELDSSGQASSNVGSCSQSDASQSGSFSDGVSDTDSLPRHSRHPRPALQSKFSRAKSSGKLLWKSFTRDKLPRDDSTRLSVDSTRDIAAVNRMSVDDMSYKSTF